MLTFVKSASLKTTLGYILPNVEGHAQGKDAGFSSGGMLILD
jgi:hypothetical protein